MAHVRQPRPDFCLGFHVEVLETFFRGCISEEGFRVWASGFRVSSFEFRVSSFGFRVSNFGFRVWGFEFRVSSFGFRVSGFKFRVSSFGFRFAVLDFRFSVFGFRSSVFIFQFSVFVFGFRGRRRNTKFRDSSSDFRAWASTGLCVDSRQLSDFGPPHAGLRPFHQTSICFTQST